MYQCDASRATGTPCRTIARAEGRLYLSTSSLFLRHPSKMDAVEYSIGVNNRFKLLEEDEDQTDVVQDSEKSSKDKKEKKAKNVRSVKDAKPQQTKKEKEAVNEETRKDGKLCRTVH